ncbi:MAG: PD40 domain-containing protein, partial [Acidobacteria bacterium]|nr:PD40 domain-containing protein [Acidobacteriota bacterium]
KIAVTGGSAVVLCDSGTPLGGSWAEDGSIVAALHSNEGIWRIASGGGPPVRVTEPDRAGGENSHRWPQILPGGEAILFTAGNVTAFEETASVVVQSLTNHRRKTLWRGGYYGRYLASGHLVYVQQDALYAVRFDSTSWKVEGKPVAVVNGVASLPAWGAAQFDFSSTGTFIFAGGKPAGSALSLVWLDSAGKLQPLRAPPGNYHAPRLAPDGKRVIVWRNEGGSSGLWLYDWSRDIMNRLTVAGVVPVWSAGGTHLAFTSRSDPGRSAHGQAYEIQWVRADGSNAPRRLVQSRNRQYPFSMSPDGKTLAFVE